MRKEGISGKRGEKGRGKENKETEIKWIKEERKAIRMRKEYGREVKRNEDEGEKGREK